MRDDELTLELERVVPAARADVFRVMTSADELPNWWGPEGFTIPAADFEASPGRAYRIEMQPPEGDAFGLAGKFRDVEPPSRLAYTFAWEDPDPDDVETLVELSLRDLGDSTQVALTQGAFKTEARLELHRNGWTDTLDKLERLLADRRRADEPS